MFMKRPFEANFAPRIHVQRTTVFSYFDQAKSFCPSTSALCNCLYPYSFSSFLNSHQCCLTTFGVSFIAQIWEQDFAIGGAAPTDSVNLRNQLVASLSMYDTGLCMLRKRLLNKPGKPMYEHANLLGVVLVLFSSEWIHHLKVTTLNVLICH